MNLTQEQIEKCIIESEVIQVDISLTQQEIDEIQAEIKDLDPIKDKLDIYKKEGRILQRQKFIDELNKILEYRKNLIKE